VAEQFNGVRRMDAATGAGDRLGSQPPAATFVDLNTLQPVHPADDDNGPWRLCEDDALLESKSLPRYSTSMHRYLYQPKSRCGDALHPRDAQCPRGAGRGVDAGSRTRGRAGSAHVSGGLLMVRTYSALGYEAFVDVLGGNAWMARRTAVRPCT